MASLEFHVSNTVSDKMRRQDIVASVKIIIQFYIKNVAETCYTPL